MLCTLIVQGSSMTKLMRALQSDTAPCSLRPLQNCERDYDNSTTHRLESIWNTFHQKLPENEVQSCIEDAWMPSQCIPKV